MPYIHFEDDAPLDTNLEDFLIYLPFSLSHANGGWQVTLCPQSERAYFALWSARAYNQPQRVSPTNDGNVHSHKITAVGGSTIQLNQVKVVRPTRHSRAIDLTKLDLLVFETPPALPVNWIDLALWTPNFQPPPPPAAIMAMQQSVSFADQPPPATVWDIHNVHAAAAAGGPQFSESLGTIVPFLGVNYLQTVQAAAAAVVPGAVGPEALPILVATVGPRVVNDVIPGAGGPLPGFVAVMAGAFAPADPREFDYDAWRALGGLAGAPNPNFDLVVDFLESFLLENHNRRADAMAAGPNNRMPGRGIPAEVFYINQLQTAAAPIIVP